MKKTIAAVLSFLLILTLFTACNGREETDPTAAGQNTNNGDGDARSIVTTIFPVYDWVRNLLGEHKDEVKLRMLLDTGVDLHNYQPTIDDMMEISNCDLFLYVGGESDGWVDDALASAANKEMQVVNLMESLGDKVKEEEVKEGMEAEAEEEENDEEEGPELDEHVWLSLKNASLLCDAIAEKLKAILPEAKDDIEANKTAYLAQLDALDKAYQTTADAAAVKTLLFADRFPFRYLTDDYGLDYFAAFVGCSAETEASLETIRFLAEKTDALGLRHIFTIEGSDGRIADAVINSTQSKDQEILVMNSLQSVTATDVEQGADYLAIMRDNLTALKTALG